MRKLVKALRKEARGAMQQRTPDVHELVQSGFGKISREERFAIKLWYIAGSHAYAKETVSRRIVARLSGRNF